MADKTIEKVVKPQPVPTQDVPWEDLESRTWGPYKENVPVELPFGTYHVNPGKIMSFEIKRVWDYKEKQWVDRPVPKYEDVFIDDERLLPGNTKLTLEAKQG